MNCLPGMIDFNQVCKMIDKSTPELSRNKDSLVLVVCCCFICVSHGACNFPSRIYNNGVYMQTNKHIGGRNFVRIIFFQ